MIGSKILGNRVIRSRLGRAVPRRLIAYLCRRFPDEGSRLSYSQEGADLLLARLFDGQRSGFYVDVSAHHPKRFSNTYFFYARGLHGINIDAMPGSMAALRRLRPRDISLEIAISSRPRKLTYYMYDWPALNTFSEEVHRERLRENGPNAAFKCVATREIPTRALAEVLDGHWPARANGEIGFLSVDVEGLDLDVRQSNDWSRFRRGRGDTALESGIGRSPSDFRLHEMAGLRIQGQVHK